MMRSRTSGISALKASKTGRGALILRSRRPVRKRHAFPWSYLPSCSLALTKSRSKRARKFVTRNSTSCWSGKRSKRLSAYALRTMTLPNSVTSRAASNGSLKRKLTGRERGTAGRPEPSMIIDPWAFRQFEHNGWQEIASRYDRGFASVTTQSVTPLLDAARVAEGARVLDVACGPGYAAAAAAAHGAIATGVDFSSEMVEEARGRYPGIEFVEGDAEQLVFSNSTFDAVVLNFGMLHLARPEQALDEAYRVLRHGGRVVFTVWDTTDKAIGFGIVLSSLQK